MKSRKCNEPNRVTDNSNIAVGLQIVRTHSAVFCCLPSKESHSDNRSVWTLRPWGRSNDVARRLLFWYADYYGSFLFHPPYSWLYTDSNCCSVFSVFVVVFPFVIIFLLLVLSTRPSWLSASSSTHSIPAYRLTENRCYWRQTVHNHAETSLVAEALSEAPSAAACLRIGNAKSEHRIHRRGGDRPHDGADVDVTERSRLSSDVGLPGNYFVYPGRNIYIYIYFSLYLATNQL